MGALSVTIEDGVAVVTFDLPGSPVNKFTVEVKDEFTATFDRLRGDPAVTAVAVLSGKPDAFIAGADIEEFVALGTKEQLERLSRDGQAMLNDVAEFPKPVVVGIHGGCLGGGLEFALAAQYRIATDSPKTELGLPEVQLGLIPGAGGCQRLPRLIGLSNALPMILTGKAVRGKKALRLGLIDELVPRSILRAITLRAARRLAAGKGPGRKPKGGLRGLLLDRTPPGRRLVFAMAKKGVLKQTRGQYPAPLAALEVIAWGLAHGLEQGLKREAARFGKLGAGDVSRRLVQLFFATSALKKDDGVSVDTAQLVDVQRIGVVGAGFMGAAIAGVAVSRARADVRMRDMNYDSVGRGLQTAQKILDAAKRRRRIDRFAHYRLSALLSGDIEYTGFGIRDLVIEAVFEDLEVKRQVFTDLEACVSERCILASNTSTIPIGRIQAGARHPGRILGMHFFSPAEKMPLLEVIEGPETEPWATASAVRVGRAMGKTVIVVADHPGFWVNRILTPYLNEASWLLSEGVEIDTVDATMRRFGFPVGPITLLDEVGLDVAEKASKVMHDAFGARFAPAPGVARLVTAGRLGRKNGKGFYRYAGAKKKGTDKSVYGELGVHPNGGLKPGQIEVRLMAAMLNEAARALSEGVVREPRDADLGAIFGFGFPPFRGGPLRYIDTVGARRVVEDLEQLTARYGERFTPTESLTDMARRDGRFYS